MEPISFTKCAVCGTASLDRLCAGCSGMAQTFEALNNEQPVSALANLLRRITRSKTIGAFYYLRTNQLRFVEQIVSLSKAQNLSVSKSEVMRLALEIGLSVVQALTPAELAQAVREVESRSK